MASPPDIDLVLPVDPGSVAAARRAVADVARQAGACPGAVDAARLAVSEACTNVVQHAYRDREPGRMHVHVGIEGPELRVEVSDHGAGLAPRDDSPGMGLGLPLMASLATQLRIGRHGRANRVAMRFALATPPPALVRASAGAG
jgi:anti-sigma regulatory factor (Ser/Thr protein kinase)